MDAQQGTPKNLGELIEKFNPNWSALLNNPGGAAVLRNELPSTLPSEKVAEDRTDERQVWDLIGQFYMKYHRWYDAIAIYLSMYYHLLNLQALSRAWVPKGLPLVWVADCYSSLGFATLSKRYLMLTLIEDAIHMKGKIDPIQTGSYFRLAWKHGLTDKEIEKYSVEAYRKQTDNANESMFPEWVLQELDNDWIVEVPNPNEASYYIANEIYIKHLITNLGDSTGKTLERLAEYLLSCIPGCRTSRRNRAKSTDYDVLCSLQGPDIDFRSELGRYFVVECKDWTRPVGFSSFAKFCRILDSVKSRFGIIFSQHGITGEGNTSNAEREQLKVFQDRGMVIIVVNKNDIAYVSDGGNMIALLKSKYEKVRLDLSHWPLST
jgi:hypothetical protein